MEATFVHPSVVDTLDAVVDTLDAAVDDTVENVHCISFRIS